MCKGALLKVKTIQIIEKTKKSRRIYREITDPSFTQIRKRTETNWINTFGTTYSCGFNDQVRDDYKKDKTELAAMSIHPRTHLRTTRGKQYNSVNKISWKDIKKQSLKYKRTSSTNILCTCIAYKFNN